MDQRFEMIRPLGQGGQGSVFLVRDRGRRGMAVALKRLGELQSADELGAEFGYLSRLRHPSLARAYDFGVDDEGAYFTSEFVDGAPIAQWAKTAVREDVVRALASLLRVLALLHDRELVHGDVSVENVLMAASLSPDAPKIPKLLDLGGACRPGAIGTGSTAGFTAPEILTGRGALPASDLYAFGAILSQVLLGTLPFGEGDASEVVKRQLAFEVTLPTPALSPIAALARDLLNPDPALRPAAALETLERLGDATEMSLGAAFESLSADDLPAPRIIQRDRELSILYGLVDQLDTDDGERVASLRGPKGSGSSTMLEAVAHHAQLNGMTILGEAFTPARTDELFGALMASIRPERLSPMSQKAMTPWIPSEGIEQAAPSEAWSASVGFAVVEAFTAACEDKPRLMMVDNFSKSDKLVQEVVITLARALLRDRRDRPRGILVVADDLDAPPPLSSGTEVQLGPLGARGIEQLVASMLPGVSWPSQLAKSVFISSEGQPKAAEQLVRQAAGPGGQSKLMDRVEEMVSRLPDRERALIAVMGVLDIPVDDELLARLDLESTSVEALFRSGFLVESKGDRRSGVRAAALAAAVAEETTPVLQRSDLARRMAGLMIELDNLEAGARLLGMAGDREQAAETYGILARRMLARGDYSSAGEYFEKALAKHAAPEMDLVRDAISTWHGIGWYDQALRALPLAGFDDARKNLLEAELAMEKGLHPRALEIASAARQEAPEGVALDAIIAACELQLGRHEKALGIAADILDHRRDGAVTPELARLSQIAGLACTYLGRVDAAAGRFQHAKAGFEAAGDVLGQLKVSANLGMLHRLKGDLAEARASYDKAIHLAREIGDRPRESLHLMNRATVLQVACNFEAALTDYRRALDIATVLGNAFRATQVELNLADLLLDMGDLKEATKLAVSALDRCRELGQTRLETRALLNAGQAALRSGDLVRAERRLLEARRRFSAAGDEAGRVSANQQLTELFIARGDKRSARDLAARIAEETQERGRWRENARALILEATASLGESVGPAVVLELLNRAEHALKREPSPDFLWRLELMKARTLGQLGEEAAAKETLERAKRLFEGVLEKVPDAFKASYVSCADADEITAVAETGRATSRERWSRDLEMLIEITQELTRERDPKRLLSLIMESAVELTGAERGMVVMPRGDTLDQVISYEISDEVETRFSRSVAEKVVREGRAVLAVDALDDDRFRSFVSVNAMKLRSILAVPLKIKRRIIGAIYLDSRLKTGVFTDADHRLLEAFGAQAAIALETARLMSENTNRCAELKRANEEILSLSDQLKEKLATNEVALRRVGALLQKTQGDESNRLAKSGIVGRAPAMQRVMKMIERIALADVPVYVFGASGTGKELVAKAIHSGSERRENPFVPVNCGALPPKLLASELFGHKRGAFTGAVGDRPGLFRLADKGTLFLDEVSDMDKEMQTHLLRVLQDGTFRSLGDNEEISVDVRILSASNRDLEEEVRSGRFREDLFYRLNVVRIDIPPLSERREDIPLLVEHLASRHAKGALPQFTRETIDVLMSADWPGNVRELENEVLRAMAMAGQANAITVDDLSPRLTSAVSGGVLSAQGTLKDRVNQFEVVIIKRVLAECRDNATRAAAALGISRATLYKKLERYGIER